MVAKLMDGYLAEVAPDTNLKLPKFQALAAVVPDYARPVDDGIYRAIDIYLKVHIAPSSYTFRFRFPFVISSIGTHPYCSRTRGCLSRSGSSCAG